MKLRRTHNAPSPMDPSEKLLRELVRETVDLVFIKDRDGRYLVANPASALVAGRPVNEIRLALSGRLRQNDYRTMSTQ
jgi:PAS domain-containing protein